MITFFYCKYVLDSHLSFLDCLYCHYVISIIVVIIIVILLALPRWFFSLIPLLISFYCSPMFLWFSLISVTFSCIPRVTGVDLSLPPVHFLVSEPVTVIHCYAPRRPLSHGDLPDWMSIGTEQGSLMCKTSIGGVSSSGSRRRRSDHLS